MKTVGCVVYEIGLEEIKALPFGWQVLRLDKRYGYYKIMHAGEDKFKQEGNRYVFFLFEAPPLPKLNEQITTGELSNGR